MPMVSLDGVSLMLDESHMEKLVTALADRLMQKFEDNWSRYLQTQLAEISAQVASLESNQLNLVKAISKLESNHDSMLETVGKLESDQEDLETRLNESDSKMDDFLSTDDVDVDSINDAMSKIENFDATDMESRIENLENQIDSINAKAIIERIANLLSEGASIMA